MRVCIDITSTQAPRKTGLFVYTQKMVEALSKIDSKSIYYLLATGIRVKKQDLSLKVSSNFHKIIVRIPDRKFPGKKWIWNQILIPSICAITQSKIFWQPTGHQIPTSSSIKKVITIHDLRSLHIQDFLPQDIEGLKMAVKKADAIITISNFTKKDIITHLNAPEEKITVIYNGVEQNPIIPSEEKIKPFLSRYKINKPFFFCLGMVPRKNVPRTIEAFASSNLLNDTLLIFAGAHGGFLDRYQKLCQKLQITNHIRFLTDVSEEEISILYSQAVALIFPSLFEGFGLPILEAQSYNCPVICSNTSAMPEVAGNSAILVNPHSIEEIKNAMELIFHNSNLREELMKKGKENIKRFSWEKSANKLLSLFQLLGK